MNGPTQLTLLRIAMIPLVILSSYLERPWMTWGATAIFLLASLTDWLDGYLARRNNQVTTLGKLLDPLADKLLILTAFLVILERGHIAAWVAIFMIGREMAITGLRAFLAAEHIILPAGRLGKWKMVTQIIALSLLFLSEEHPLYHLSGTIAIYVALIFALISAYYYVAGFWGLLGERILEEQNQGSVSKDNE